jgi:hypothetical protein
MPKRKAKKTRLSAPMTVAQKAALEEVASQNDVSIARVIQQAIKEFLETHKDRRIPLFETTSPRDSQGRSANEDSGS